jgi:hypothetical protein
MAALSLEPHRMQARYSPFFFYKEIGFYSEQVIRYLNLFTETQIKFLIYEELKNDPLSSFKDIFRFLGVEALEMKPPSSLYNPSGYPKIESIQKFINRPNRLKKIIKRFLPERLQYRLILKVSQYNLSTPTLDQKIRKGLLEEYEEDILKTQEILNRDLSFWLTNQ